MELELHWTIYPPDYNEDIDNSINVGGQAYALELFHSLGNGTELWCMPKINIWNCTGTKIVETEWLNTIYVATNRNKDE